MFRMTRIVPTIVLTVAALALVAPAAQARPVIAASGGTTFANPSVHSTQDWAAHRGTQVHSVVVTTGDTPLANPVQLPTTAVNVPDSPGNGFDWTAAAIGASVSGILMLMLAAGVGFRRRGQLAA